MRKRLLALSMLLCVLLTGCGGNDATPAATEAPKEQGEPFAEVTDDKDFSSLRTPGSQEAAYEYKTFFLPAIDGISQPYVGDTMPYYENGTYYIYYLKEGGDSYNHSLYLATTTDFSALSMSASTSPVSTLRMMVPGGTLMTTSLPFLPIMSLLLPLTPFSASKWPL